MPRGPSEERGCLLSAQVKEESRHISGAGTWRLKDTVRRIAARLGLEPQAVLPSCGPLPGEVVVA